MNFPEGINRSFFIEKVKDQYGLLSGFENPKISENTRSTRDLNTFGPFGPILCTI